MIEQEEYELKLILRAFRSARVMYSEEELLESPGLLLLEIESLRNLDAFNSTCNMRFKSYKEMKDESK